MMGTEEKQAPLELILLDAADRERYEVMLAEDGTLVAFITYRLAKEWIALLHTEVQPGFEGHGMGSRSATLVFDDARARGLRIIPKCPFILRWLERHPEQRDALLRQPDPSRSAPDSGAPLDLG